MGQAGPDHFRGDSAGHFACGRLQMTASITGTVIAENISHFRMPAPTLRRNARKIG